MTKQFPAPKRFKAKVIVHEFVNPGTVNLTIELLEPEEMVFLPGQFINLQAGPTTFRSYSIWSNASDTKHVSLVITAAHNGVGANFVRTLKVGDIVTILGPSGRFVVNEDYADDILMMVTGTGIAPTLSMLYRLAELNCTARIRMYWGLKDESWLFFTDLLEEFKANLPNFSYDICLDGTPREDWQGNRGRITDFYQVADPLKTHAYICGNPYMCEDVIKRLTEKGLPQEHIYHENFTVASKELPASATTATAATA